MNYLVFPGNILHLTPNIIKGQVLTINRLCPGTLEQNFFCVIMYYSKMLYNNVDQNPYVQLFKELGVKNYRLFNSSKELIWFLISRNRNSQIVYHKKLLEWEQVVINGTIGLFKPRLLSHCSLICWGAGDFILNKDHGVKRWFFRLVLRSTYNKYKYVFTLSKEDFILLKEEMPDCNGSYTPYLRRYPLTLSNSKTANDIPIVMVSHSGWPHNNHLESFNILSKYAGKIKVLCPLCYGEEEYINKVIEEGSRIFGTFFHYFRELLDFDEYKKLLNGVDIFVSSAECQTGLGAINLCIGGGSRVYVKGNLYRSMKQMGIIVERVNDIKEMSISDFCRPLSLSEAQHNVDMINKESYDGSSVIDSWTKLYSY